MVRNLFRSEALRMRDTLFHEDILVDQFNNLEASGIIERAYTDYFNDCSKYFDLMGKELLGMKTFQKSPDVEKLLSDIKQSSARVGAIRMQRLISDFEEYLTRGDGIECCFAFWRSRYDFDRLKANLETYFELRYRFPVVDDDRKW